MADIRRGESRKFGFRQNSYINFKVEQDYFFCLIFLGEEVKLTVKPMYADDLWWDIWDASENKAKPLSLRGTGVFSLSGQVIATYSIQEIVEPDEAAEDKFRQIFSEACTEISKFLAVNPDANVFYPDESQMDDDPDRLLYLMALIHNGRKHEVLQIIRQARKDKHECMFQSGLFGDSYTYISRSCRGGLIDLCKRMVKGLTTADESNQKRLPNRNRRMEKQRRKPWYRRLPLGLVSWVVATLFVCFFYLHRRTLYDEPWWVMGACCVVYVIPVLRQAYKLHKKHESSNGGVALSIIFALIAGLITSRVCIGVFDGVNYLFAAREPITTPALTTHVRRHIHVYGRGAVDHYISVVLLPAENRSLKIDDEKLFHVPPDSEVMLTYRRGFFGMDIYDSFTYRPKDDSNGQGN